MSRNDSTTTYRSGRIAGQLLLYGSALVMAVGEYLTGSVTVAIVGGVLALVFGALTLTLLGG